ncbi:MAG: alkaline phosphatase family protein [Deltaproteobacteria bacterium]|nr:alkaline phosphatase family protein [Deltaproteobacteria bacterium]
MPDADAPEFPPPPPLPPGLPPRVGRVVVIGLDCAAPDLVFDRLAPDLPILGELARTGVWGRLKSTDPPITVPAWASMFSGCDPGELGLYGFRNRRDYGYDSLSLVSSREVTRPRVWDHLGARGLTSIVLGPPPAYPPPPVKGLMVGCFLTPDKSRPYTHPAWLASRLDQWAGGEFLLDVEGFRRAPREKVLEGIWALTRSRFTLARHLATHQAWDLLLLVDIAPDRLHHAFWQYWDPEHPAYRLGSPWERALPEYYAMLDREVGLLLDALPPDTLVLVVSDHGAQAMQGGLAINQWLLDEGYLALRDRNYAGPLIPEVVDWPRTRVWGEGGYYARLNLNLAGREPQGRVRPGEAAGLVAELRAKLGSLPGPDGAPLGNQIHAPAELYRQVNRIPPDLLLYPGGLAWRSLGTVGLASCYSQDNDQGPDGANHHPEGMFIASRVGRKLAAPPGGRELATPLDIRAVFHLILRAVSPRLA